MLTYTLYSWSKSQKIAYSWMFDRYHQTRWSLQCHHIRCKMLVVIKCDNIAYRANGIMEQLNSQNLLHARYYSWIWDSPSGKEVIWWVKLIINDTVGARINHTLIFVGLSSSLWVSNQINKRNFTFFCNCNSTFFCN